MPRPKSDFPSYCVHKRSGQAYVTLDGRQIQLGKANSQDSQDAYNRAVGEWLAAGRRLPAADASPTPTPTAGPNR